MRRSGASDELLAALEHAGGIDLPTVWDVVTAWWRTPLIDVAPDGDVHTVALTRAPTGHPPPVLAMRALVRLDLERAQPVLARVFIDESPRRPVVLAPVSPRSAGWPTRCAPPPTYAGSSTRSAW